ncbi:TPA: ParA family protein [Clostridioides difficile]|nr:ParA family protein [Clostridioides difficile]HBF9262911.1 ParA family protein [Clostridioides difficile]HBG1536252.1 ParA family protein [Clostridioides difficile]HCU2754298.1 ParA family protein [Clostridioides difficile]
MAKKFIAIWGSPNSGKTTLSIKIAREFSLNKENVLIIFCDYLCPVVNTVLPYSKEHDKSIGNVLSSISLERETIFENLITVDKNKYIATLGYKQSENLYSYPEYSIERVVTFFNMLKKMDCFDYIIVDCSSYFLNDQLTTIALEMASDVIRTITPDPKSISYFDSSLHLLIDQAFDISKHRPVLSSVRESDAINDIEEVYNIKNEICYLEEVREQFLCGELFSELVSKRKKIYNNQIKNIVSLISNQELKEKNRFFRKGKN